MKIDTTGFILYTLNYEACIHFYEKILELPVLYRKPGLTCFQFHGAYLMVEIDDEHEGVEVRLPERDRFCLRINVADVKEACNGLDKHEVAYRYSEFEWGTVAQFRDPDGNKIAFRSAKEHLEDMELSIDQ